MRHFFTAFLGACALLGGLMTYSQLVANSRYIQISSSVLRNWADTLPPPAPSRHEALVQTTRDRVAIYEHLIQREHLVDGMLVNRTLRGHMLDQCDSLLFSSLHFVALNKLGRNDDAYEAWRGIQNSQDSGHWRRHPRCFKSTSRDMILGLLMALSQKPDGYARYLESLIKHVKKNDGYFSNGPIYVSYLTPGVARLLGMLAPSINRSEKDLPEIVRDGYSTSELTLMVTTRGYQAHLVALSAWLEMEINDQANTSSDRDDTSFLARAIRSLVAPLAAKDLESQRLHWTTQQLVAIDHENLFFRYLRLKAANALSLPVRQRLLEELLAMPQFPVDRLPMDCDRRADYLWQRASREYSPSYNCRHQYHGVDFIWMASLLLESEGASTISISH